MPTVLIAEPERHLLEAYRTFFSELGFQIHVATDGLACLSILRTTVPDLLILDAKLLWGGGEGVLAVLQEESNLPRERVVITATVAESRPLEALASSLGVRTLTKPFPVSALFDGLAEASSTKTRSHSRGRRRRGVLIVDDEGSIRELLRIRMERDGFRAWAASSGEEALVLCKEFADQIAVIILDIQMPGMSGPETFEEIAKINVQIPVCFMTGDPGKYEPGDLLMRGARHVFHKPFRMNEFAEIVLMLAEESMDCRDRHAQVPLLQ